MCHHTVVCMTLESCYCCLAFLLSLKPQSLKINGAVKLRAILLPYGILSARGEPCSHINEGSFGARDQRAPKTG